MPLTKITYLIQDPVGAENSVRSCDLHILVYEATEPISSQRPKIAADGGGVWAAGGC